MAEARRPAEPRGAGATSRLPASAALSYRNLIQKNPIGPRRPGAAGDTQPTRGAEAAAAARVLEMQVELHRRGRIGARCRERIFQQSRLPCGSGEGRESFLAPFPKFRRRGKRWLSCSSGSPRASPVGFPCRCNGWRRAGLKVLGAEKTACEPSVRYKSKVVTFQCSNF